MSTNIFFQSCNSQIKMNTAELMFIEKHLFIFPIQTFTGLFSKRLFDIKQIPLKP